MSEKHEPITIDVEPHELQVVRPRLPIVKAKPPRPRSPVAQARDMQRMGKILQTESFWIGLIAELWIKR